MYCSGCGKQLSDNALFCPACGTPVKKKTARCPDCRQAVKPGAGFCGSCGAALDAGPVAAADDERQAAPDIDRPVLTWKNLCKLILINWKNSLRRSIPLMLIIFFLSLAVHTFLLVYYNEGFGQGTWLGRQMLATQGNAVSATVLWTLLSGFIFATIPAMRKKGLSGSFSELFSLPGKTVKFLRECGPDGLQMFLTGIGLTLVISSIMSGMTSLTLALGMAALFAMPLGRILAVLVQSFWMTLLQALRPEQARNVSRFGIIPAYLLIIGTAAGFALGTVLPVTLLFGLMALAAVVVMIFTRKTPPGAVTQALLFFSVLGYAVLCAKGVAAHDGGWLEGGGTWETWITSQGAFRAVLRGLGPAIGASIGPGLIIAGSSVGPGDFRFDDGLPVESVTTPVMPFKDPEAPAEVVTTPVMPFDESAGPETEPASGGQVVYDQDGYDPDGYDRDGYNREGYDREGYDRAGYDSEGYDKEGYSVEGFDRSGFDAEGYNFEGYDKDGYNREGYGRDGYNRDGYDSEGYDRNGIDRDGYDFSGFNGEGYDREGYDANGFNREGFDHEGYGQDGYDREGYNRDGYDRDGFGRDGYNKNGYNREGYNSMGFNRWGFNSEGRNPYGMTKEEVKEQIKQRILDWKQNRDSWEGLEDRAESLEKFYGYVKWGADQGVDLVAHVTGPTGNAIKHSYHFIKNVAGGVGEAMADDWRNTGDHVAKGVEKGAVDAALRYVWDNKAVKGLTKMTGGKVPGLYDYGIKNPLNPAKNLVQNLWGGGGVRSSTAEIVRDRFWQATKNVVQKDVRNLITKDPVKNWINKEIGANEPDIVRHD
jgi:hypothetical protein